MTSNATRNEYIRSVRNIGESLIKNAESIVGDEKYLKEIHISADVVQDGVPSINISRSFYPESIPYWMVDDE